MKKLAILTLTFLALTGSAYAVNIGDLENACRLFGTDQGYFEGCNNEYEGPVHHSGQEGGDVVVPVYRV